MSDVVQKSIDTDLDQSNMHGAISSFPDQLEESFEIIKNWSPVKEYQGIQKIMILGMGGSAIGGDVARVIAQNNCSMPIFVNRSYTIPRWVDSQTLIIASSYSGNTEEILSAFSQCVERNCSIIVLSTGGKLTQNAKDIGLDLITIPKGYQPRCALGFSLTLILLILERFSFISKIVAKNVKKSIIPIKNLCSELSISGNSAMRIAEEIHCTCPIIYGSEDMTWVVAMRLRGQLAENAKMLSFQNNFPEQNHNEIEGWTVNEDIIRRFSIIWLRDINDHPRNLARMVIVSSLLESTPDSQLTISQSGPNRVERILKLIHYIDWISYYAAILNNVDPTPVNRIQELKDKIAQID